MESNWGRRQREPPNRNMVSLLSGTVLPLGQGNHQELHLPIPLHECILANDMGTEVMYKATSGRDPRNPATWCSTDFERLL